VTADGEVLHETEPLICPECNTPPETAEQLQSDEPELVVDAVELYPKQRAAPSIISPQNAYLIGDMLWDVVRRGTGARARSQLGRNDLAGKTGTTNEGRDTWFVGFNANIVGASWVGFDDFRPLGGNEQGSSAALPMWIGFMGEALARTAEQRPKRPRGIVEHRINPESGLIADDACRTLFSRSSISTTCRSARWAGSAPRSTPSIPVRERGRQATPSLNRAV
jgi:penicillin-binding protein 1A